MVKWQRTPTFHGAYRLYVENKGMSMESRQGSSVHANERERCARHICATQTRTRAPMIGRRVDIQGSVDTLGHNVHSDLTIGEVLDGPNG